MSSSNNWLHKLLQQNVEKRTVEDLEKKQDICTDTIAIFHHFLLTHLEEKISRSTHFKKLINLVKTKVKK